MCLTSVSSAQTWSIQHTDTHTPEHDADEDFGSDIAAIAAALRKPPAAADGATSAPPLPPAVADLQLRLDVAASQAAHHKVESEKARAELDAAHRRIEALEEALSATEMLRPSGHGGGSDDDGGLLGGAAALGERERALEVRAVGCSRVSETIPLHSSAPVRLQQAMLNHTVLHEQRPQAPAPGFVSPSVTRQAEYARAVGPQLMTESQRKHASPQHMLACRRKRQSGARRTALKTQSSRACWRTSCRARATRPRACRRSSRSRAPSSRRASRRSSRCAHSQPALAGCK
jgi:hypothetical protein